MAVNYEYYRIFYYVAKYRNLTQAAAALFSSQPNVTRAMKQLEHELGCQLFLRSNRGILLTPEGEQLYSHVAVAFKQLQLGEAELIQSTSLQGGTVSIGASETALHLFLLDKLRLFLEKYPGVRLKIYNYNSPQALSALKSGQIDYAVIASPAEAPAPIRTIHVKNYRDVLVGGSGFQKYSHFKNSLKDLSDCPLIGLDKNTSTYSLYNRFYISCGLVWEPDIEVATADLILPMVENNLGIGYLPYEFAEKSLSEGKIFELKLKESIPRRSICMMYDGDKSFNAAARVLGELLQSP